MFFQDLSLLAREEEDGAGQGEKCTDVVGSVYSDPHMGARRGKLSCGTSSIRDGGRWESPGSCSRSYVVLPFQRQLLYFSIYRVQ